MSKATARNKAPKHKADQPPRPEVRGALDDKVTPIRHELAKEIGLNESIMLVQIAFWVKTASDENFIDGQWWTYQSAKQMQEKAFGYWSTSTINRTANKLIEAGYLIEANYNKKAYDRTRWFALNIDAISRLKSVSVILINKTVTQNASGDETQTQNASRQTQNASRQTQNDTPIPESPTENTTETPPPTPNLRNVPYLEPGDVLPGRMGQGQDLEPIQPVYVEYQKFTGNTPSFQDRDLIQEAIEEHGHDAVLDAIKTARGGNIDHKPTWNYVSSILRRRHEEAQQVKQKRADFDTTTGPREKDPEWEYKPQTANFRTVPTLTPEEIAENLRRMREEEAS